jgi:hypothetical protein
MWTATAYPALDFASAVVGGVVACAVGRDGIPLLWREATEAA